MENANGDLVISAHVRSYCILRPRLLRSPFPYSESSYGLRIAASERNGQGAETNDVFACA